MALGPLIGQLYTNTIMFNIAVYSFLLVSVANRVDWIQINTSEVYIYSIAYTVKSPLQSLSVWSLMLITIMRIIRWLAGWF